MNTERKLEKITEIVKEYFKPHGPTGEPDFADAHDYLLAIDDVIEEKDADAKAAHS